MFQKKYLIWSIASGIVLLLGIILMAALSDGYNAYVAAMKIGKWDGVGGMTTSSVMDATRGDYAGFIVGILFFIIGALSTGFGLYKLFTTKTVNNVNDIINNNQNANDSPIDVSVTKKTEINHNNSNNKDAEELAKEIADQYKNSNKSIE